MAVPTLPHSEEVASFFKHQRLASETSIRVLELLPCRKNDAQLQINIRQMELEAAWDKYEAVSYVWGSLNGSCPIYCDGRVILVTPNCRDFLFHLRHKDKVRSLWVDSICIDQTVDGDEERVTQIQRMGQIYHQARRVLVWLGHGDQRMRMVFRYLQYFGRISLLEDRIFNMRYYRIGSALSEVVGFWGLLSWVICSGIATKRTQNSYRSAFLQLLHSPWFLRAWTVQEVAASRNCIVLYERSSVPWKVFTSRGFPELVLGLKKDDYIMIEGRAAAEKLFGYHADISTATSGLSDKRAMILRREISRSELVLLRLIRHLIASRPEDKIYSMYSIFTLLDIPLPTPDYKKPVRQVLEDFVLGYIHSRKNLALLAITLPPDESSTLPSWVPDWLTPPRLDTHEDHITNNLLTMFHFFKDFKASCRQEPILMLPRMMGRLMVAAKRVARVKSSWAMVSAKSDKDHQIKEVMEEILPSCQNWVRVVNTMSWKGVYESHDALVHSALQAIIFPRSYYSKDEDWRFWFDVMLFPNCREVSITDIEKAAGKPTQDGLRPGEDVLLRLLRAGSRNFSNRLASRFSLKQHGVANGMPYHLIILENSRFGTVYRSLAPSDEIFLLAGANLPFALRHNGTDGDTSQAMYRLVSPAFIPGAMDGEFWPVDANELTNIILV